MVKATGDSLFDHRGLVFAGAAIQCADEIEVPLEDLTFDRFDEWATQETAPVRADSANTFHNARHRVLQGDKGYERDTCIGWYDESIRRQEQDSQQEPAE